MCCWRPYCAVGVHNVLLGSLLMLVLLLTSLYLFLLSLLLGSPFCCWCCDVLIVSATISLPPCCSQLHLQASLLLVESILCWRSCCCFNSCCCLPVIGQLDYCYRTVIFFCYRTIGISNIVLANSRKYRTIRYQIKASIYRTTGCQTQKKTSGCPPMQQAWLHFSTCWG